MKQRKRIVFLLIVVLVISGIFRNGYGNVESHAEENESPVLSNPKYEDRFFENGEQIVTWDKICIGSYPQIEVVPESREYAWVEEGLLFEGDLIYSDSLYYALERATGWNENEILEMDEEKYCRVNVEGQYHYFRFESIEWRVLQVEEDGGKALLLADKILDGRVFHNQLEEVRWRKSGMRSWLNGYSADFNEEEYDYQNENFMDTAFSLAEQNAIMETVIRSEENGGKVGETDMYDKIFLLSLGQCDNEYGKAYGFSVGNDTYRYSMKTVSSTYALWHGVTMGVDGFGKRIGENWWLRSFGKEEWGATMVEDGLAAVCAHPNTIGVGVRPAMYLNIEDSSLYTYVGTVSSDFFPEKIVKNGATSVATSEPILETSATPDIAGSQKPVEITPEPAPSVASITPLYTLPPRISSVRIRETKNCDVKISWSYLEGAQSYDVYRSQKKKGIYTLIKSVNVKRNSYTDKSVVPGRKYYYKVLPKGIGDEVVMLDMAIRKKISLHYLAQPVIQIKKARTSSGKKYVEIFLKSYQGDYVEIYYKTNEEVKYHKLPIQKKKIVRYGKRYRIRYNDGGVTLCFKVRTFVVEKGKKKYSRYSKVVRKRI